MGNKKKIIDYVKLIGTAILVQVLIFLIGYIFCIRLSVASELLVFLLIFLFYNFLVYYLFYKLKWNKQIGPKHIVIIALFIISNIPTFVIVVGINAKLIFLPKNIWFYWLWFIVIIPIVLYCHSIAIKVLIKHKYLYQNQRKQKMCKTDN